MKKLTHLVSLPLLLLAGFLATGAQAASVGSGGYTNDFLTQPGAADWSTFSIGTVNTDYSTAAGLDAGATNVLASSINTITTSDPADPPALIAGLAVWSSTGRYLQTRPTGNGATLLLCTLVNSLGVAASGVTISYDFAKPSAVAEEVEGHRAYYSLNGTSWTVIPEFSSATPGRLTVTLNVAWAGGGSLYLMWADDNGAASDSPCQIDNFSAIAISATQTPANLTTQPQNQTVAELSPANFSVGVTGNPAPTFQWYRNDAPIAGATNATYAIASAQLSDHGAQFKVTAANTASNVNYSVTSSGAVLTVNADTVAPVLVRALSSPPNSVLVDFSEAIRPDTATVLANYSITNAVGNLTISGAVLLGNGTNVLLTTSARLLGATYTLIVNGIRDLSAASNQIAANSLATFTTTSYAVTDIGSPAVPGTATAAGTGYNLTARGNDIGGTTDQFTFNYQLVSGNFDLKVRVVSLSLSDLWAKAGLMARETLTANSRFAAMLTTPGAGGTFFSARTTAGAAASTAGSFPINHPYTWLRLARSGDTFTGYASLDGDTWMQIGSTTLSGAGAVYLGMAAASYVNSTTVTAQFRDVMTVSGGTIGVISFNTEPPGPSSRRTPIAITEIMYQPAPRMDGRQLEFIELYNSNPYFEDIGGWKITGDVEFTFPANATIPAGGIIVLAKVAADVQSVYGLSGVYHYGVTEVITNTVSGTNMVVTNIVNSLSGGGGTLRLRNKEGAVLLEISYSSDNPWPLAANGLGHSLVLARPSYGEGSVQAWSASDIVGGSPGRFVGMGGGTLRNVVINEILAHTDDPLLDYIELYNHGNTPVDISGCILTDDPDTNIFLVPANTIIPARGFVFFEQNQLNFSLSSGGETIYFRSDDDDETSVLDALQFEAQANGVSFGRYPDGAKEFYPMQARTKGTNNSAILVRDIVINEIMYKPISADENDEYVELYNKGTSAVNVGNWRFTAGIDLTIPANTIIGSNGYLVVAKSKTNLLARHPNLNMTNTVGDFDGSLANRGERLALAMPDQVTRTNNQGQLETNTIYIVVDEVTYGIGGQWGQWANEGGSSLELIDPRGNHRLAHNWADSDETTNAPWTTIEATGVMDLGASTANFFEILALNEGEWLVDNVEVIPSGGANAVSADNSTFQNGQGGWAFRGTHIQSFIQNTGGYGDNGRCLHVKATARGDAIHNRCLVPITTPSGTVTLRARVRWLRGWPEMLVRLHGNTMEATGRLLLPPRLGTPGARNPQAVANAAPAIYEVSHAPVVPAASQAVIVSARVEDADGVASVVVNYRLDPSGAYAPVTMNDAGTGGDSVAGDGVYSGTIPGQSSGALVAYFVQATDSNGSPATVTFPRGASPTTPECLVRFGDPIIRSAFGVYRQWMTAYHYNIWNTRPALSNERLPVTFVYGNFRAIQFAAVKWAGSPYHQFANAQPNATGHYSFDIPSDDLFLGTDNLNKVHGPGNGPFDDGNIQREQTCYWLARQLGLPWNYRRAVNMYFNGNRPGGANQLMEDTETPGNDVVESRFPDDPDGNLFKLQPWFEVDDGTTHTAGLGFANNSWCSLTRYTTVSNGVSIHKLARYRHNFLARAVKGSVNDYADVFSLIDAADVPAGAGHVANMEAVCDMEQWMRTFAVHHSVGDWDHFGSRNSQNMYGYKAASGRWKLMIWDMNIVIGNGSSAQGANLFEVTGGGANMTKIYDAPPFRRMYFRALKELCNVAFVPANMDPVLDSKYAAYLASGVSPTSPANIKSWIATARSSILSTVAGEDATTFAITGTTNITTANNLITLTGNAPVEIKTIKVNGIEYPVTWTSVRGFTLRVPVSDASSQLVLRGYDVNGNLMPAFSLTVTVNYTGLVSQPQGSVVINEIMFNPLVPEASFIEIFNKSAGFTFDLSNWRVNGVDFTFPVGSIITNRQHLVLAKNRAAFATAYGTSVTPAGEFGGGLDDGGETLTLIKPGATEAQDLIVDRVKYDDDPPWPAAADGMGPSLQLIDADEDNSRVSNWSDGAGWRYASYLGTIAGSTNQTSQGTNFFMYLSTVGGADVYIDDVMLVLGSVPGAGANLLQNGDFEAPLAPVWTGLGNHSNSVRSTSVSHSGSGSLHVIASGAGTVPGATIRQVISGFTSNMTASLSFWYLPSANGSNLIARTAPGSSLNTTTFIRPLFSTPGGANTSVALLPAYDPVWLNELQPNNVTGVTDGQAEREPWIELYNAGPGAVDLSGYYLANNYNSNLTQWQFPAGAMIASGEYKIVWADGETNETVGLTELHASFRLTPAGGSVALVRIVGIQPQITDYLNYSGVGPDLSYGSFPDGQPFDRRVFFQVTHGNTNSAQAQSVFINEWMAGNAGFLLDTNDNTSADWFELYNPGDQPVDLSGAYLTDVLTNKTMYRVPDGTILAPHSFMLFWADEDHNTQNAPGHEVHVNFRLSANPGEAIGLYSPYGTLMDAITFGRQTNNISQGRFSDGAGTVYYMTTPTPRAANSLGQINTAPELPPIANRALTLGQTLNFIITATDADFPVQTLTYSLVTPLANASLGGSSGVFTWTPTAAQTPGSNSVTVRVTDNGNPALIAERTFNVAVFPQPVAAIASTGNGLEVSLSFPTIPGKTYRVEYTDNLNTDGLTPLLWQTLLPQGANQVAGSVSLMIADTLGEGTQRFYRIVTVD